MNKTLRVLVTSALVLSLSGCATIFGDKNRTVLVSSNPTGAKVYFRGAYIGDTPAAITVNSPLDTNTVEVRKDGYFSGVGTVKTAVQASTFLNILFWPGIFVDLLTGDIKRVEPNLIVNLTENHSGKDAQAVAPAATTEPATVTK